jgi:hypothetical protein
LASGPATVFERALIAVIRCTGTSIRDCDERRGLRRGEMAHAIMCRASISRFADNTDAHV